MNTVVMMTGRMNAKMFCVAMLMLMNAKESAPVKARTSELSIVVVIRQSKNAQISKVNFCENFND
jgi:hypothetical protein